MVGAARWHGTYYGKPAIALSYHGGGDLWTFDEGKWIIAVHGKHYADLTSKIGLPWRSDAVSELPLRGTPPNPHGNGGRLNERVHTGPGTNISITTS